MSCAPILAQVVDLAPEAPPLSERMIALLGLFTWLHLLATLVGVVYVCAQVAWQRGRRTPVGYLTVLLRGAFAAAVVVAAGVLLESNLQ